MPCLPPCPTPSPRLASFLQMALLNAAGMLPTFQHWLWHVGDNPNDCLHPHVQHLPNGSTPRAWRWQWVVSASAPAAQEVLASWPGRTCWLVEYCSSRRLCMKHIWRGRRCECGSIVTMHVGFTCRSPCPLSCPSRRPGRPCAVQPPAGAARPALPRTGLCGLQGGQAWGLWLRVRMAGTAGWHGMQRSALGSAWAGSGPAVAAHQLLVTTGRQLWVVCSRCRLVGACPVAHRPMLAAASVIKPLSASPRCRCCMEWTTPQTNEQRSTARCVPHF